jgi:phosphoglycerol transferase MdoB-like AlkP superfamily enzyme
LSDRLPSRTAAPGWTRLASAHALVLFAGLLYFKTVKLIGVALQVDLGWGTSLLAYAQDIAIGLVWLTLLLAAGPLVRRRAAAIAALGLAAVVEAGVFLYGLFNVHYFRLFGIPLNLEAIDDIEHVGGFWSNVVPYFASGHTVVAAGLWLVAVFVPVLARRPFLDRSLRVLTRPLVQIGRSWRGPVAASAGMAAVFFVPIDPYELAKNDAVELVASAFRMGRPGADAPPIELEHGTNVAPPSWARPDDVIEPSAGLVGVKTSFQWKQGDRPPNVVFIVLESMVGPDVARRLGIEEAMPFTLELAERSVVLEDYSTVFPLSMKSLVTLTCSILPSPQRITVTKFNPRLDCRSVSEVATEHGYRAGLFHAGRFSFTMKDLFFEDRGFDPMIDANDLEAAGVEARTDYWGIQEEPVVDAMLDWFDQDPERPFLAVYVPVVGHYPYTPLNPKYRDLYGTATPVDEYKNAVAYMDAMVEKTIKGFRRRGVARNTIFVIVGDHGLPLELHPNNEVQSAEVYEENVRTLGYIYLPGQLSAPVHYGEIVQHPDILPSIYDLLGWEVPDRYAGVSIFSPYRRKMAIHYTVRSKELAAVRDGHLKAIYDLRNRRTRVYDLSTDPGELEDVADAHGEFASWTEAYFDAFIPAHTRFVAEYPVRDGVDDLPELRRRIDAAAEPTVSRDEALARAEQAMRSHTVEGYRTAEALLLSAARADARDFEVLLSLTRVYDRLSIVTDPSSWEAGFARTVRRDLDDVGVLAHRLHSALRGTFSSPEHQGRHDATLLWSDLRDPNTSPADRASRVLAVWAAAPDAPETWAAAVRLLGEPAARRRAREGGLPFEALLERLHAHVAAHPDDWFVGRELFALYAFELADPQAAFALYPVERVLASGNPSMLSEAGDAWLEHGHLATARDLYRAALASAEQSGLSVALASLHSKIGGVALLAGEAATARASFAAAVELDTEQPRALSGLAMLAARAGDVEEADRRIAALEPSRRRLPRWSWVAHAEVAAAAEDDAKPQRSYAKSGGWEILVEDSRFHTAVAQKRWATADRALRALVRDTNWDPIRASRYLGYARQLIGVHPAAKIPITEAGLRALHEASFPDRALWRRVDRARRAGLEDRAARLATDYLDRFPGGTHKTAVENVLAPPEDEGDEGDAGTEERPGRAGEVDDDEVQAAEAGAHDGDEH